MQLVFIDCNVDFDSALGVYVFAIFFCLFVRMLVITQNIFMCVHYVNYMNCILLFQFIFLLCTAYNVAFGEVCS